MKNIKVLRRLEMETQDVMVRDQILVSLAGIGDFIATAHKITDRGILFIFDECVVSRPMNKININEGGYEKSDLKDWIGSVLLETFPRELRDRIVDLSIPTVSEVFGHDDEWNNENFEPDNDEQLSLMKERRNRMAFFNNEWEWWWLRNAAKRSVSSAGFASVDFCGDTNYYAASVSRGVRPEFWLVK